MEWCLCMIGLINIFRDKEETLIAVSKEIILLPEFDDNFLMN